MKPKILTIILLSSLLLGCRTRNKSVEFSKEGKTEIERVKLDSTAIQKIKAEEKKKSDYNLKKADETISGDIIIKGKSDSLTPLIYHNIINGDTIQSISISGNADYLINNHYKKSKVDVKETFVEEKLNEFQKIARKSVSKATIKKVAKQVETMNTEIKSKGFSFGIYFTFILWGAVFIAVYLLIRWIKKTDWFTNILNRFTKK